MAKNSRALARASGPTPQSPLRLVSGGEESSADRPRRLSGVDALRGFAVACMVVFHLLFDLHFFCAARLQGAVNLPPWFLTYVPDFIGGLFLLVVGISAWLARRSRPHAGFRPFFRRGLRLAFFAALISAGTIGLVPSASIYFGVLHCIAVSSWLVYALLGVSFGWNLGLAAALVAGSFALDGMQLHHPWLMWLGLPGQGFVGQDYYPLVPWFGMVALGLGLAQVAGGASVSGRAGNVFQAVSGAWRKWLAPSALGRSLAFLGRHSLVIYLTHQLVLVGFLKWIGWADLG